MWRACLVAGRLLTRLPLPDPGLDDRTLGRAALCYPVIGLVVGTLLCGPLWASARFVPDADPAALAALTLILWVWLSGGLHLDGLADCADAWVGGLGDRGRTFEILRDPRIGTMGALALILALLVKWVGLLALIRHGDAAVLIWLSVLARGQLLLLVLTTPCARPQGMGAELAARLPRSSAWAVLVPVAAGVVLGLGTEPGLIALAVAGLTLLLWRRSMVQRLGGFTGDTMGALVELTEVGVLLALSLKGG